MKSKVEIMQRYKALSSEKRRKYLEGYLSPKPCNCAHNRKHTDSHGEIRLCFLGADDPENWPGNICDTVENARKCPFFKPKRTREELIEEHDKSQYVDLLELRWVLGWDDRQEDMKWYQRFLQWLSRE